MNFKINKDVEARIIASIQRYFRENMENEIGNLEASRLLNFVFREIGPAIYNHAITDAQAYMQAKVSELDVDCYAEETSYWKK